MQTNPSPLPLLRHVDSQVHAISATRFCLRGPGAFVRLPSLMRPHFPAASEESSPAPFLGIGIAIAGCVIVADTGRREGDRGGGEGGRAGGFVEG